MLRLKALTPIYCLLFIGNVSFHSINATQFYAINSTTTPTHEILITRIGHVEK